MLNFMLSELGMHFVTGVPDSCIATFCAEIDRHSKTSDDVEHAIASNEGSAIGLAVGNYLATGDVPLVYMQNSGLGNAANPILSAAHPEVYGVPMVVVIGWRGAPGTKDEPQHVVAGRKTVELLDALDVGSFTLPKNDEKAEATMREARDRAVEGNRPVAVLVEPKTFSGKKVVVDPTLSEGLKREAAIERILGAVGPRDAVVSTTGFTSRELYEIREKLGQPHESDFLCVGSMGHSIAIAQGVAIAQPDRTVWCLDGDGAALMHLGSFTLSAPFGLGNLRHVLLNNDAHESVGGQPTTASQVLDAADDRGKKGPLNFVALAASTGYDCVGSARSAEELDATLSEFDDDAEKSSGRPKFLEVKVALGTRSDLGRPKTSTATAKEDYMNFLAR